MITSLILSVVLMSAVQPITMADVMISVQTAEELEDVIATIVLNPERHRFQSITSCQVVWIRDPYTFQNFPRISIPCGCRTEIPDVACFELLIQIDGVTQLK